MSLKNIELQHALPKTPDIGKIQEQLHQKNNIEQSILMSQLKQKEVEKRNRTERFEKTALNQQNTLRTPKVNKSNNVKNNGKDPSKGRYVDLEL